MASIQEVEVCPTCGGACKFTGLEPPSKFPEIRELNIERQLFECDNCGAKLVKNVSPHGAGDDDDDDVDDF